MNNFWNFACFIYLCLFSQLSYTHAIETNAPVISEVFEDMFISQIRCDTDSLDSEPNERVMDNMVECQTCNVTNTQPIMKPFLSQNLTAPGVFKCSWQSYAGLLDEDNNPSCTIMSLGHGCVSSGDESLDHLIIQCPEIVTSNMMKTAMNNILPPLGPQPPIEDLADLMRNITHFEMRFDLNGSVMENLSMFQNITTMTVFGCRLTFQTIYGLIEQLNLYNLKELKLNMTEYPLHLLQQNNQKDFNMFQNITLLSIVNYPWDNNFFSSEHLTLFPHVTDLNLANVNITALGWDNILLSMPWLSHLKIDLSSTSCQNFPWNGLDDFSFSQFVKSAVPWNEIINMHQLQERKVSITLPPCEHWDYSHLSLTNLSAFHFGVVDDNHPLLKHMSDTHHILNISHNKLHTLGINFNNGVNASVRLDASHNQITNLENSRLHGLWKILELQLSHNCIKHINSLCFYGLSDLEILRLDNNQISFLSNDSFEGLDSLTELDLGYNKLLNIPLTVFKSLSKLSRLVLNNNFIENVYFCPVSVSYIDLSSNPLKGEKSYAYQAQLEITSHFDINLHLPPLNITRYSYEKEKYNINVEKPEPSGSILETVLFQYYHGMLMGLFWEKTTKFSKKNVILHNVTTKYLGLDFFMTHSVWVDPEDILNHIDLDISINQLECGCKDIFTYFIINNLYHYKDLNNVFYLTNWICAFPTYIKGVPFLKAPQRIFKNCTDNLIHCPKNCACYQSINNMNRITVDCAGIYMTELPSIVPEGTEVLDISMSNLTSLCKRHEYLDKLIEIDVSHNQITQVCDEFVTALNVTKFNVLNLRNNDIQSLPKSIQSLNNTEIFLQGNNLACTCENTWLKYWVLGRDPSLIPGAKSLLCKNVESTYFLEMDDTILSDLCTDNTVSWLGLAIGSTVVLALVLLTGLLVYRFWRQIKVWCFVKFNWHPFDQGDMDDNIENMDYDVFISYSHLDLKWVRENLLDFLQKHDYSVCLHEKDWPVGVLITENILLSVKHSRRMIMVLSKNYLTSEWCRMEFQVAHKNILDGRTKYLIMVALDDVDMETLPPEIDFYVKTHTYLEAETEWFQKRLIYAMPKKTLADMQAEVVQIDGHNLEMQRRNIYTRRFPPLFYRMFTYKEEEGV